MIKNFIFGFVSEEMRNQSLAQSRQAPIEELSESVRQSYENLPQDRFPQVIRLARYTTNTDGEEEFRFGLQVLFDGFSERLNRQ